jgi:hypothetical protein
MAIHARPRDFQQLFSEIDIQIIPFSVIKDITFTTEDGSETIIRRSDFRRFGNPTCVKDLQEQLRLTKIDDIKIRIDFALLESDVHSAVDELFDR